MDSIRVSEAPDTGSIPVEATKAQRKCCAFFIYRQTLFLNNGIGLFSFTILSLKIATRIPQKCSIGYIGPEKG